MTVTLRLRPPAGAPDAIRELVVELAPAERLAWLASDLDLPGSGIVDTLTAGGPGTGRAGRNA